MLQASWGIELCTLTFAELRLEAPPALRAASHHVADLENQDIASGVAGKARKIGSRVGSLGLELQPFKAALKDAVDSMIANNLVESTNVKRRKIAA